jgi:hypothetical protein
MAPYVKSVTFECGRLAVMAGLIWGLAACETNDATSAEGGDAGTTTDVVTSVPDATTDGAVQSDVTESDATADDATNDAAGDAVTPSPDAVADVADTETAGDTSTDTAAGPDGTEPTDVQAPDAESDVIEIPPDECATDEDCAAGQVDMCIVDTCGSAEDGHKVCMQEALICEASDLCLAASCDSKSGCTEDFEASPSCCFQTIHKTFDFEGTDAIDVSVTNQAIDGTPEASWTLSNLRSYTGEGSYYFGIPEQLSYENGKLVAADLDFPSTLVSTEGRDELVFHIWLDVEEGDSWDVLILSAVNADGISTPIWVKTYDNVVMQEWQTITVDLGAFAGQEIGWRFSFNSVDHTYNDGEGIYIDAVWMWTGCESFQCNADEDCDDGIACTADSCVEGSCTYDTAAACCVVDADCFDGDNCTVDACLNFACENVPVANPECCNTDLECDDGNECTIDSCDPDIGYECVHPVDLDNELCCEEASHCNDDDTCTIDTCNEGLCGWVNTCCFSNEECNDFDDVCTVDSCVGGACVYELQDVDGCCDTEPMTEDFEGNVGGWTFSGGGGGCQWQLASGQSTSGAQSLYYGNLVAGNFDCGESSGSAQSQSFDLQANVGYHLKASIYMDTEGSGTYDKLFLYVVSSNGNTAVWTKPYITTSQWFDININLNAWAGQSVSFKWTFDSVDSLVNYGQGTFVDDMVLTSTCEAVACGSPADCNDGVSASSEVCDSGSCSYSF